MPAFIRHVGGGGGGGGGSGFSVSFSPAFISAYSPFVGDTIYRTPDTTVTGGTPSYTYAWTRVSGDTEILISSTTVAEPTFSATGGRSNAVLYEAIWRLTVTDSLSAVVSRDLYLMFQIGGGDIQ